LDQSFPILIAEDNPVSLKLLEKTLTNAGYRVACVENGLKALELFKKKFFPIILSDWMMPEMDGVELCRAVRKTTSPGYVFIILLTGKDSKDDIITGLEAGADDYLTKPFNQAELIARLNTAKRILELEKSLKEASEEIRILSITDPLTGSYNRGYLTERLPQEIQRAKRYGHSLSLVLGDIDHFKKVNDSYGHRAGDLVLKEFVQCILNSIRVGSDWLVRYGGEEFLVVAPETSYSGVCVMAERLRQGIAKSVIKIDGKKISITASFGISGFDPISSDKKISPDALIELADKYLYQAKQEGRNRVKGSPF
jgi:diguanylate cyclase (GGDEF)-like protein